MASQPGPMYEFPWERFGSGKYLIFAPYAAAACLGWDDADNFAWHMLAVAALRYAHAQAWNTLSRLHAVSAKNRIYGKGVDFKQVDREANWDDYIILQLIVMTLVHKLPGLNFGGWPLHNWGGMVQLLLLHVGPTEFVYYWVHRALHWHPLYQRYHSHHHASFVTEPITGSVHPFAEHLVYTANFAIPLLGTFFGGGASWSMFYVYLLGFDMLNAIGHCNFEFIPSALYMRVPLLKYLIYTPTFHSLHHSQVKTNFCLFMPLYDYIYGTVDPASDSLYLAARAGQAAGASLMTAPDTVFLGHGTELLSFFHLPFMFRGLSAHPYYAPLYMYLLWPLTLPMVILTALFGRVFTTDKHSLGKLRIETWCTPAVGFEFFMRFRWAAINRHIGAAIAAADAGGVRVIGLGALNKNEALNGGGKLFVDANPALRVRVVHGNTLTAAAVLQKIPPNCSEVFLTGATSKLGRACALYLSERGVTVRMMTASSERYASILAEARSPAQAARLLRARDCRAGAGCCTWVVGKHLSRGEQAHAPRGTTFHQFVVPPIPATRADCEYTGLPAFRLPPDAKGFRSCEMTLPRRVVHACHAGALVHSLEEWDHHEVGAIDPARIDSVLEAALRHGFSLL